MFFRFALLSSCLLVSTALVLAAPSSRNGARVARRREGRQSQLNNRLPQSTGGTASASGGVYSVNWAGALWDEPNGTFTSVTGTFTVPAASGANGAASSVWVGIDGDTCMDSILQTGIDFGLTNGQASYNAWYEWYPDAAYLFSGINMSAGDVITLTVVASSTTSGTAMVENMTNGQRASQSLNSTYALCQQNAEWIVEDFEQGGSLVPFANFSAVTFTNAVATGNGAYTPSGATVVNIQQNNQVLTSVSVAGSSVTITHV